MAYTIAIDGPAASGKSSAAERVAEKLGFARLDSGSLYRAITHVLVNKYNDVDLQNEEVKEFISTFAIKIENKHLYYDGEDITEHLRSSAVDKMVGIIARELYIRNKVQELQHELVESSSSGIIIDGRDIGTVVLPNAFLKVFINASDTVRANRRKLQSGGDYMEILEDIQNRDYLDINREHGPLKIADDAILLCNDNISLEDTVDEVIKLFEAKRAASK
ncbi:CMP/dCMP kinase [Enteropsectra breve]|nr:CMP/dCMP kinase [Enteropsectra breve]